MPTKQWKLSGTDIRESQVLQRELGCLPITAQILWRRGYRNAQAAHDFLTPDEQSIECSEHVTDLDRAVERLHKARARGERVRVFGDYDVDGVSSTALMMRALRRFGVERLDCYIPERETDGYGISPDHIRAAATSGVDVMVTVDNGISAHDAAREADQAGVDMIITDHHSFDCDVPAVAACVNPKRDGADHPLHNVSGSTVAWLVARELIDDVKDELAYVALGTIADVMPLTGINRPLVAQGLNELSRGAVLGISALAGKAKVDLRQLRAEHVAFQIGPRLNAVGRLGDARAALDLLLTTESAEAARLSRQLDEANVVRRQMERKIFMEAVERLEADWDAKTRTIVLGSEGWSKGIIGIVASKIADKYERPTALLCLDGDGLAYASARSRPGFDLMEALTACNGRLKKYGGHRGAAGFTLAQTDLACFIEDFERAAGAMNWEITPEEVEIDAVLSLSEIDARLLHEIARMEPYGHGNPEPLFCTCAAIIPPESIRVFNGGHLGLCVEHHHVQMPAIAFHMGEMASSLQNDAGPYDVLYRPKFNTFRNRTTIQLQIQGIRRSEG